MHVHVHVHVHVHMSINFSEDGSFECNGSLKVRLTYIKTQTLDILLSR